jgi:tetratricopeptide (TPR) repeat protein
MSDCQVRAALAGYQSSVVQLGRRSVFESPDIGTIVLTPLGEGEVPARDPLVSVSEAKAPEKAAKAYEKAKEELFKDKPNPGKAEKELQKAVKEYPEYAAAWYLMGEARMLKQDVEGAREALSKATETDPGFATPYVTRSLLELSQKNLEAAAKASDQAIELAPSHVEARYYNGMAYANLGDFEKAKASLDVVTGSPHGEKFPQAFYLLGTMHGQEGNVEGCVSNYRRFLELEPDSQTAQAVRQQLDQWKSQGIIQ